MSWSEYEVGTYSERPVALVARRSVMDTVSRMPGRVALTYDINRTSGGWTLTVVGSSADVEAFRRAWE